MNDFASHPGACHSGASFRDAGEGADHPGGQPDNRAAGNLSGTQIAAPARVDLALPMGVAVAVPAWINGEARMASTSGPAAGLQVADAMTRQAVTISPNDSAQSAARLMAEMDVGVLPVEVPGTGTVVGIVTDRDIVTSVIANGMSSSTAVYEFMTVAAETCRPDDRLEAAEKRMRDLDLRRLVVVDDSHHVVGVLSRSDASRAWGEGA